MASNRTHSGFQPVGKDEVAMVVYRALRKSRAVLFVLLLGSPSSLAMALGSSRYCCDEVPST